MAKEKSERKEKRSKEDKEQRASSEGVSKKSKKDKKKDKKLTDATESLLNKLDSDRPSSETVADVRSVGKGDVSVADGASKEEDEEGEQKVGDQMEIVEAPPVGLLVPFANPLADDKTAKKVFKAVKKAATHSALKRGVKEVVKSLRTTPQFPISTSASQRPSAVVVLAADISPFDIISHLPVLCEDQSVPYIYVRSRAELGAASGTKRPTSVVMVTKERRERRRKKKVDANGEKSADANGEKGDASAQTAEQEEEEKAIKEAHAEVFADLVKVVEKAGMHVKI